MGKWLTQEWIDDVKRLGSEMPERHGMSASLLYIISDTPVGDIYYSWIVQDGRLVDASLGDYSNPDVTLTISMEEAKAMAAGKLDAASAFMQGQIGVEGDLNKLMSLLPLTASQEYLELERQLASITDFDI